MPAVHPDQAVHLGINLQAWPEGAVSQPPGSNVEAAYAYAFFTSLGPSVQQELVQRNSSNAAGLGPATLNDVMDPSGWMEYVMLTS